MTDPPSRSEYYGDWSLPSLPGDDDRVAFSPRFQVVSSISTCADLINRPHEDYPRRVLTTEKLIRESIAAGVEEFDGFDLRSIHSAVMWDLPKDRGMWRTCNVRIMDYRPPDWQIVPDLIDEILPVGNLEADVASWYRAFQMVHPFRDGNGRVGGIVLAVLTYTTRYGGESMLAPLQ